ncbi:serine/threonine protein kinase [Trichormus variabilis ATCC 29413]|uniref:non-specific serine/threonine protein kinase n=3 Tax=Nostocaceae TaxID=1162 RepID=Q3MGV7_TRIV2|nr:serine/threonine protein kinase [Trichormus variabilis ATCC 29413]MBC1214770.1 protein kinase [Trichormus variabilis ARAD]MBC1256812.1 protein kinase [Trichormus variabilis V5]MBC1267052.1 protein kinase [Trichormus variabilis FSR]MBC1303502.1 protein kinase [Trichormus variabilis N2B]MBC1311746.1 protein kinase [Trichormus variabilis PNB]MBC1327996.1 protein kinase [Trichormus variabilis 9RC]MBD2382933.1 protein kinase [Trichormus variabilis FACHB-319]QFZ15971.1 serine/threonine protein
MLGQLLDGRYKITQVLGAGGFGKTYIAEDIKLYNNLCVVKQLQPTANDPITLQVARRLFASEAELLHKLGTHDQIPQLLAHFEEHQEFFLVQQFIDGHPLSDELTPGKRLSEAYTIALLKNILQPLAFVHQNNVIHRDIKPPNLIRRKSDGKVVLIDFGAVKQIGTQVVNGEGVTKMTVSIGTAGYMPSEQSRGSPRLSSDVYAVGMIGIQALTGLMPHQLQEDIQTAEIIWRELVQVSPNLADVLDRMVRYDFRQRYQSAVEALAAVQNLGNAYAPTQTSPSPGSKPTLPVKNHVNTPPVAEPPLYSPPPAVPAQYRQEVPKNLIAPPPPTTAKSSKVGISFYLQWVLVNIVGLVGGGIVGAIAYEIFEPLGIIISSQAVAATMGLTIGFIQALVLRRQIPVSEKQWVLGTTLGVCISVLVCGDYPEYSLLWIGPIVGSIQWFILKPYVKQAVWWILVNTLFGWIGGIISGAVLVFLLKNLKDF